MHWHDAAAPPVTDDEIKALLAYVKSLSKTEKKK